jgi:tetratricopeptide (TPR) repeat protein
VLDLLLTIDQEYETRAVRTRIMQVAHQSSNYLPNRTSCWFVPFERNPQYVNREVVGKVKRRLFISNNSERIAIFGLGGVGKTQIALELAYQTRELYPDCAIFWLPTVDMESLQHAYQTVAGQLGIDSMGTDKDVKALVKSHLSRPGAGRWLLIFDNADDIDMWTESKDSSAGKLREYLPSSEQGAVVFTTRSNKVAQYLANTDVIKIPEMDEHKATQVLRNCLVEKELLYDTNSTQRLLDRLTFLPLAIVQAASFINENKMTLAGYVELLDGQEQSAIDLLSEDFEDKGRYRSIRNPVATTWLTSFEQIIRQNRLAADYLCYIACIKEKDIPISILPLASNVEQQKAIGLLGSYSFVRVRHEDSRLDMHRLVQLATRNWLQSINSLQKWQLYALKCLDARYPQIELVHRSQWRATVPHAIHLLSLTKHEDPSPERIVLLFKVETCQRHDGRFKQSEELCKELIEVSAALYGPGSGWAVRGLSELAHSYSRQGKWDEAIKLCEQILEMETRLHGSGSLEATHALLYSSSVYHDAFNHYRAQELCRKAIPYCLEVLGPDSNETINAMGLLISTYIRYGQFSDAIRLSLQLLHIYKRIFGTADPRTLHITSGMAIIYIEQWRLKEAEVLLVEGFEISKQILGTDHPETITVMALLAATWEYQGRHRDAISLQTECISLCHQRFGSDHFITQSRKWELEAWTNPK